MKLSILATRPLVRVAVVTASVAFAGAMGCSSSPPEETGDAYVSQTIVTIDKDGKQSVRERILTQSQARAEFEAARSTTTDTAKTVRDVGTTSEAITQDLGCAGSSLWLWDSTNQTGNELCFKSDSSSYQITSLSGFTRCTAYFRGVCLTTAPWTQAIRSYWGGVDQFFFVGTGPECLNCRIPFSRVDDTVTGDSCARRDTAVGFNFGSGCTAH